MYESYAWQHTKKRNMLSQHSMLFGSIVFLVVTYTILYILYCSEFGMNPFDPDLDKDYRPSNKTLNTSIVFQVCSHDCRLRHMVMTTY